MGKESKKENIFLQHGYQPKKREEGEIKPPKRGSNIVPPKNNDFERFIKICMDKFGTDKAIICLDGKNWGIQPIKINDITREITETFNGIYYYRAGADIHKKD